MGPKVSILPTKSLAPAPVQGCWFYERFALAYGLDCNCHKTSPRRCNPGPPPFPDSMAEWLGMPPPPPRPLTAQEAVWQQHFTTVPNPYPMLDGEELSPRDVSIILNDTSWSEADDPGTHSALRSRKEPTDPRPDTYWGPVPFNGLSPPVEALMPDEIGRMSFIRTTNYNRHLERLLFNGDDVRHAIWHTNKHMPFRPQLTIYRLWTDNRTYLADWDPRVVVNLVSGSILYQTNVPQQDDILDVIFDLMPARHIFALQYCAMQAVQRAAVTARVNLIELLQKDPPLYEPIVGELLEPEKPGMTDQELRNLHHARHISVWMACTMQIYQIWKDVTGMDVARNRGRSKGHSKREDLDLLADILLPEGPKPQFHNKFGDNEFVAPNGNATEGSYLWNQWSDEVAQQWRCRPVTMDSKGKTLEEIRKGGPYSAFAIPWYTSPYHQRVKTQPQTPEDTDYRVWETPLIHFGDAKVVPWSDICEDVAEAAMRWRSINTNDNKDLSDMVFQPDFRDALQALNIMSPKLRELGHGARIDRLVRLVEFKQPWALPRFMTDLDMCLWFRDRKLCIQTGHAIDLMIAGIRQQIGPPD